MKNQPITSAKAHWAANCRAFTRYENQGCGVGVETGVGADLSRPFWPKSESELESVKFCQLRFRPGVAGCHPSTDDNFGRKGMHRLENIERQEENESGSVELRLGRRLVIEVGLKKGNGDNFSAIVIVVRLCQQIERLSYPSTFKGISEIHAGCIRSRREWVLFCHIPGWMQS